MSPRQSMACGGGDTPTLRLREERCNLTPTPGASALSGWAALGRDVRRRRVDARLGSSGRARSQASIGP